MNRYRCLLCPRPRWVKALDAKTAWLDHYREVHHG